ncbi:MAG: N-acetyl sugar amidotransferase [Proteobacteria bacterium]|nr:N-acetyl sugar amidotransferase [Pseudomonadota bacterium]NOG59063.1 N-acetyl sugar amidotransferase [Pseudomonadota bacterium]
MTEVFEAKYGLPQDVKYCKACVISNQRPSSVIEFKNKPSDKKPTINFDDDGVCSACRYADVKKSIDWNAREKNLIELCDKYRSRDGSYDCIVPGSGGKDSAFTAHVLKYKYGMNPLTVTWSPHVYTDIGWRNFRSWIDSGLDNILYSPNGKLHRLLTRLAFENLVHPFQPFIIGQRLVGPRFSMLYNIPLVFYGENQAEYGNNITENESPKMDMSFFYNSSMDVCDLYLGGVSATNLIDKYNVNINDLNPYMPLDVEKLKSVGTEVHYLGYYLKWDPQECFYYAAENTGFITNPERTEGSYSKYSSIDDKIDPLHYFTTYIKFGIGRATYDASQEIRNGKINREEGAALVKRFDSEFPSKYFHEILDYMDITEEQFWKIIDAARSPHLWKKENDEWMLRHALWNE